MPTTTIKTGNNWKYRLTQLKVFTATSKFFAKVQKHELNKTQRQLQTFTQWNTSFWKQCNYCQTALLI